MATEWKPTWAPGALDAGLTEWLGQHGHAWRPQGQVGLGESRAHPDYKRWQFMLGAVTVPALDFSPTIP